MTKPLEDTRKRTPGPQAPELRRREFLKLGSTALGTLALSHLATAAGPFSREDFTQLVPADKKLKPDWVKSLFERGTRTVYRGAELEKIGMPVGGICAGQVYLGGDGKLWHWDIFNRHVGTGAEHYAKPMPVQSPLEQGFALKVTAGGRTQVRALDRKGWAEIAFTGEYPLAFVEYRDPATPVQVTLEAFSPFIPLNLEDSSLPATVMRFTVRNPGPERLEVELAGWLQNAVCLHSAPLHALLRRNRIVRRDGLVLLECAAEEIPQDPDLPRRPDILFDDFERETHGDWTATGDAFGSGPVSKEQVPGYQGDLGLHGNRGVNSHASAPGTDVGGKDARTGTLTSKPFTVERHFISFLVGGGAHKERTCVDLVVEGQPVLSTTGRNDNRMQVTSWDVRRWEGKIATLRVVDLETGGWGNIGIDDIRFTDRPRVAPGPLTDEPDFGTMTLALLEARDGSTTTPPATAKPAPQDRAVAALPDGALPEVAFGAGNVDGAASDAAPGKRLVGAVSRVLTLGPGEAGTATFVVTWHFPNLKMDRLPPGRWYGARFPSASAVAFHVRDHFTRLREQTLLWHDTWYDSTLPYWFLDRTFLNTSILATATCHRFANGRFWAWEGVGCCHGTCGHVWQYAHAMARLFPELERDTRERVDFGLALQANGAIHFRAEYNDIPAIDAQAGTVLRALREHQMSVNAAWLERNWPAIRSALDWLIRQDGDGDGLIVGSQHNTLDTDWYGPVAWLSGLYLAALRAGEEMAGVVGDTAFAARCREILARGVPQLVTELFDGEYFINKPDPAHTEAINSGTGCHIDQVFGQSWAFQVGLGRILPQKETLSALQSLWRYNFTPDVGPYRAAYKPGRWYAMAGEGGLLMCTFPRRDWDYAQAKGKGPDWAAGYFNECMNGFEYQVAGHMIAEGMVMEGLAVTRMVHDRYHPLRRNPWNEVECGDHYARSMASYGVFLTACGFTYDGPRARIGFAPPLDSQEFRCAFTAAEGWGTFEQRLEAGARHATLTVKWGRVRLAEISLRPAGDTLPSAVDVQLGAQRVQATLMANRQDLRVRLDPSLTVNAGHRLVLKLT